MKRDSATTSLWQTGIDDYVSANASSQEEVYDVLIAGGGITGITTALLLQQAGKKVLLAEAHSLCFGTTGGTTGHINTFLDTSYDIIESKFSKEAAQLVAKATEEAGQLFRQHVKQYTIDCGFEVQDGYVYAQTPEQVEQLDKMLAAAKAVGIDADEAPETPVPIGFQKAIVYRGQAQLHPSRYVVALAKAFEAMGGVIIQNTLIKEADEKDGVLTIKTDKAETYKVKALVWATHIPPGKNILHLRNAPYRSYAIAVKLEHDSYPIGLAYDSYDPYHYYRTQEIDGEKYLIIGGEDHKTGHEENTHACFNRLIAHSRTFFNIKEITHHWSSQYFEPADGLAYIGHLPGNPANVYVATGFGGNGITYSHIAAKILSDLIVKGDSEYKDLFAPSRIKPIAGFVEFVKENADVVKEFVGRRISVEKIEGLSALAHGEAKVVKYEGEKIALYKDDGGRIHALNPVCPHLKCIVAWNSAEKTWDCPCHGGRFSADGEVLTGPARGPLEKIDIEKLSS